MENRPLIRRVVLENYRSIGFCDVRLGPLSILVGPNGSGKSNFLDALRFLSEAMTAPVENAFQNREGFSNVLRRGATTEAHLGIRVEFQTTEKTIGLYLLRFKSGRDADYVLDIEKFSDGAGFQRGPGAEGLDSLELPQMAQHPEFTAKFPKFHSAFRSLSDWRFYAFLLEKLRQPVAVAKENTLRSDGGNLPNVLHYISLENHVVHQRITDYLRVIYPALQSISSFEAGGFRILEFHETSQTFHAPQVSDGTLRALAVLVALFQRQAGAEHVRLVGLEEPETALHPAAAGVLFDAMREASASVQVVATTHSADLLDKKDIDTDTILSVELESGTTHIGHVNETGRKALRDQLYTAGELMRMNYLRPDSPHTPDQSQIESVLFEDLVPAS